MFRPSRALTVAALLVYSAVMITLTTLKSFYRIGYLWDPEVHRRRELRLTPFGEIGDTTNWFIPVFGYLGNLAFFVPFGLVVYVLLFRTSRPLLYATLAGLGFSVAIEGAQFLFALGYTDIDDVLMNTLGGFLGAWIARLFGPRFHGVWVRLALVVGAIFAVLVGLGERLGDPAKIVENQQL